MAEKLLTAKRVEALKEPGRYSDGGGLYLNVASGGSKSWVFIWIRNGKRREMGLGSAKVMTLAQAREARDRFREQVANGTDPIAERAREREAEKQRPTFGAFADELIAIIETEFRNEKHRAQWRMTLKQYAAPLRDKFLDDITTEDVLGVLQPLWRTKQETASRLRGRIERVLDAAKARGLRTGENPARWRGHLDALLPKRQKLQRGHHAAMPYAEVPDFVAHLRTMESVSARGLEFLILAAARSGEVLGAQWAEIDLNAKLWTVPAQRMKAGRIHRVPLSDRAVEILREMALLHETVKGGRAQPQGFIFPGLRGGLSVMAFDMLLRRMNADVTVHGFRSSFRDWAGEQTDIAREVAEAALAHVVGDATERAYARGDMLERRRRLMEMWAAFLRGG